MKAKIGYMSGGFTLDILKAPFVVVLGGSKGFVVLNNEIWQSPTLTKKV